MLAGSYDDHVLPERHRHGLVARNRADNQFLLHQLAAARLVRGYLRRWRGPHGWPATWTIHPPIEEDRVDGEILTM